MKELFSLGDLYVSDFLSKNETPKPESKVEMKIMYDDLTSEVRLEKCAPASSMYGKYWYRSGINLTMRNELKGVVDSITSLVKLKPNDLWLDIACNDGTLLSYVPKDIIRLGIDPVEDSYKQESEKHASQIIQDYFSRTSYNKSLYANYKAKVITCIAMFYDLDDPDSFLEDVYSVMDIDGLLVLQMSYTPLMLKQMAFDNICHEHIYYYTLHTINNRLRKNGFKIVDCQINDVNGGSFRIYVMKNIGDVKKFGTQPYRDVCNYRTKAILETEYINGYNTEKVWHDFYKNLISLKSQVIDFIVQEKQKGKKIWGYGASTKGNTLLQYFGIDNRHLDGIAERSPYKYGLRTVGTNIPIFSEEDMRKEFPDYLLVLPWHFINEFVEREKDFLNGGGKFIVPCPKFEIIGRQ
jgi:2-polyprenyl-3-methyl-5-hydroxy-6-metoxy-1,4-benzoquinol methylase